jgi:hypothetical protein
VIEAETLQGVQAAGQDMSHVKRARLRLDESIQILLKPLGSLWILRRSSAAVWSGAHPS